MKETREVKVGDKEGKNASKMSEVGKLDGTIDRAPTLESGRPDFKSGLRHLLAV